jgi:hypothetical protein
MVAVAMIVLQAEKQLNSPLFAAIELNITSKTVLKIGVLVTTHLPRCVMAKGLVKRRRGG